MTLFDSHYRVIYDKLLTSKTYDDNTFYIHNFSLKWDMQYLPLLSLRRINLDSLFTDLLWQLSGSSNVNDLHSKAFIWKEWANEEGYLQSSYGRHLRQSPTIQGTHLQLNESGYNQLVDHLKPFYKHGYSPTLDQLKYAIVTLSNNPQSRRAIIDIWQPDNACNANQPPCLIYLNFNLIEHETCYNLTTFVNMRSTDFGLGFVFDIMHYYMISEMIKTNLNLYFDKPVKLGYLYFNSDNFHVYRNQIKGINTFANLNPKSDLEPKLHTTYELQNGILEPVKFEITDYVAHPFVSIPKTIN